MPQIVNRQPKIENRKPITGVILAGGLSKRLGGRNKALIQIGGETILHRLYRIFQNLFDEIIIVSNQPLSVLEFDCLIATDLFPIRASLTGIHTGLFYASNDHVFVCACDTPFLKQALVKLIIEATHPANGVTMPDTSAGMEPLCAVYAKQSLPLVEQHVARDQMKIQRVFGKKRIRPISEKKLRQVDPELISFFNINRPEDLEQARRIGGEKLVR